MAQQFHDSLTAFKASMEDNGRLNIDSLHRFKDYSSLLSAMPPDREEEIENGTDSEGEVEDEAEGEQSFDDGDSEFYKLLVMNG